MNLLKTCWGCSPKCTWQLTYPEGLIKIYQSELELSRVEVVISKRWRLLINVYTCTAIFLYSYLTMGHFFVITRNFKFKKKFLVTTMIILNKFNVLSIYYSIITYWQYHRLSLLMQTEALQNECVKRMHDNDKLNLKVMIKIFDNISLYLLIFSEDGLAIKVVFRSFTFQNSNPSVN